MSNSYLIDDVKYKQSGSFSLGSLSFYIPKQQITSIIGPNGSGKSTTLRLMANLLKPDNGCVFIEGKEISQIGHKQLARKMTMLSQIQNVQMDIVVRDLVSHGRLPHCKWHERLGLQDQKLIDWALSVTSLTHLQFRSLQTLSGGERQRAWIAMAIVQSPEILLLDEPTTYLDISHQLELMNLVEYLNSELHMTIVMVLHDLNQAAKYSDRLVVMKEGKIFREGSPGEVFDTALFKDVFSIEAKIFKENGVPYFIPLGLARNQQAAQ
ncbi:ABC transporter ATP-binding protein [Paenibacillus crassostreae]|uniref:ABC transporter ATP-binding protein n=1 Tax=Paenibacillus crassostreae TaxID=1763538 RepID=A0A167FZR2_9BACL|nr:ABC transporter ATP-binding protein [Paenibacillus crassostreae]AOZ93907.1 ABC transporter ATP-binding protein [Paenibacillus crassostreae]OAB77060.1 ABC transporter ATP-binding protein [Paenibacillus crassostreae]